MKNFTKKLEFEIIGIFAQKNNFWTKIKFLEQCVFYVYSKVWTLSKKLSQIKNHYEKLTKNRRFFEFEKK